ncbi:head maturation protease, ClpP-related [Brevibacillus porteri]|uniref:head maturation protease, ClpP-related n=1 Tax=Brevibacillus porteri TaxID=2126350 RepID=UPI003D1DD745
MPNKFWEFKNVSESEAELHLYGDIASETPWWDDGDTVTARQFIDELKALGTKSNITVRINSIGGDVFAAQAIFTQLKLNPANITIIIDGLAASAATIVAMAGDTIKMPNNALMMIHNPLLGLYGYYNVADFEKLTVTLETVKESIMNAYLSKASIDKNALSSMMDEEKWMTAEEAKELGFVDEILFSEVQAAINGKVLVVNSIQHDMSRFKNTPTIPTAPIGGFSVPPHKEAVPPEPVNTSVKPKEAKSVEIKNIDELRQHYPELVKQIENAAKESGQQEERQRIQSIEEISNTVSPALVNKAKYEQPMNAQQLAFEALKADQNNGRRYLNEAAADADESGTTEVNGQPLTQQSKQEKAEEAVKNATTSLASFLNRGRA